MGMAGTAVIFLTRGIGHPPAQAIVRPPPIRLFGSAVFPLLVLGGIAIGIMDEAVYQHLVPHLNAVGFDTAFASLALSGLSLGYVAG